MTKNDISREMTKIASSKPYSSPYLARGPVLLKDLFSLAADESLIERVAPSLWRITESGKIWRDYKFDKFVGPDLAKLELT